MDPFHFDLDPKQNRKKIKLFSIKNMIIKTDYFLLFMRLLFMCNKQKSDFIQKKTDILTYNLFSFYVNFPFFASGRPK